MDKKKLLYIVYRNKVVLVILEININFFYKIKNGFMIYLYYV